MHEYVIGIIIEPAGRQRDDSRGRRGGTSVHTCCEVLRETYRMEEAGHSVEDLPLLTKPFASSMDDACTRAA
jgi:hypothetical protein